MADNETNDDYVELKREKSSDPVKYWLSELEDARKREKDYRENADRITAIYEADDSESVPFNILYSNTETLLSAIFGTSPQPAISQRYRKSDPIGRIGARIIHNILTFLLDQNSGDIPSFESSAKQAVLEAAVPGRGVIWFKYNANIKRDEETDEPLDIDYESVEAEQVAWDNILIGYARIWGRVPWIAREWFMTREELIDNFEEKIAKKTKLTVINGTDGNYSSNDSKEQSSIHDSKGADLAHVYEIWDKTNKEVLFISPGYKDTYLRKPEPDPLHLSGFFPTPEPLMFFSKIRSMVPVPLYQIYEQQANELNIITVRLKYLIKALKVRGCYNSALEGIDRVLEAEDNTMIPAENAAALEAGTFDKAIWMVPIEKIMPVVQQLFQQREGIKAIIYEITGIADIMRGSTRASETATAQTIKNQWGGLRIKRPQKEVARYMRECLRIMTEIAVTKFSPSTIEKMTGIQLPAKQELLVLKQRVRFMTQQGQKPHPKDIAQLEIPPKEVVYSMLKSDVVRSFIIDIETNSTMDIEASEDRKDMGEMLNVIAQFFNGLGPMIENNVLPFAAAKELLLSIIRRFRLGPEVEEKLRLMQQPKQRDGKERFAAMQKQIQNARKELQKKEEGLQKEQQKIEQGKLQLQQEVTQFKLEQDAARQKMKIELRAAQERLNNNRKIAKKELQLELKEMKRDLVGEIAQEKLQLKEELQEIINSSIDNADNNNNEGAGD